MTGSPDANSLNADPVFLTNYTNLRLQKNSTLINSGVDLTGSVANDYSGTSRPQGSGYDIGAYEYIPLTVTVNQKSDQSDPTVTSPINFTVVFSESVSDFATGDVTLSGTAGATTGTVTGSGTTYNVAVTGMTGSGTVVASLAADVATGSTSNTNEISTSSDNTVTYDITAPTLNSITISDTGGFTNSATPSITISSSGSPSHVAFSCNSGSNWSDWIAYASPISSFNITNGATGCTSTNGSKTITAKLKDSAGNESSTADDATYYDSSAPTSGSIDYVNDYSTSATIALTVSDGSDGSGAGIDTSSRIVQRSSAALSGGNCDIFGGFSTFSHSGTYPNFTDTTVLTANCYKYRYLVSDNVTNQATYTSANIVKVDLDGPALPGTPVPTPASPTTETTQTWEWTAATDTVSGIANYLWRVTTSLGAAITNGSTATLSAVTNLTEGIYNFFVKAVDNAGNEGTESQGTITIASPTPTFTPTSSPTITPSPTSTSTPTQSPTPSPTTVVVNGTVSNSSSSSSPRSPVCEAAIPGAKASWLYGAIPTNSSTISLYFTPADLPVDKYVLEYGLESNNYIFGVQDIGLNSREQMNFNVNQLLANKTYFFRIRSGNGCATGPWSNEISAKTKTIITFNGLDITSSDLKPVPTEKPVGGVQPLNQSPKPTVSSTLQSENEVKDIRPTNYLVRVKVQDSDKNPVAGANVTLHSNPQTKKSNSQGIAEFNNVEPGDHRVLIAYNGYEGEQSINLTGAVKEFNLNITVEEKSVAISPIAFKIIFALVLIIGALIAIIIGSKNKYRRLQPRIV